MMDRRKFLRILSLGSGAAAAVQVAGPGLVERAIKYFFFHCEPSTDLIEVLSYEDINALAIKHIVPSLSDNVFQYSPLFYQLKYRSVFGGGESIVFPLMKRDSYGMGAAEGE